MKIKAKIERLEWRKTFNKNLPLSKPNFVSAPVPFIKIKKEPQPGIVRKHC